MLTKDSDFVLLLEQLGSPPQVLWLTIGNTLNEHLKEIFSKSFPAVQSLLLHGEPLVEISEAGRTDCDGLLGLIKASQKGIL